MTSEEMKMLETNIEVVRENIRKACKKAGRDESEITLVAATKMNDTEKVSNALQLNIDAAGENRVQELLDKYEKGAYKNKPLHFIGTLQSNKVKYLVGKVTLIHSVSSVKLAQVIGREAEKKGILQDILLEINVAGEYSKSGIEPSEIYNVIEQIREISSVRIKGLMAIPPKSHFQGENISYFNKMYQLFIDISTKKYDNVNMDCLSMGMSDDYEDAIICGSTMVRIGTAIFGERKYRTTI